MFPQIEVSLLEYTLLPNRQIDKIYLNGRDIVQDSDLPAVDNKPSYSSKRKGQKDGGISEATTIKKIGKT
ncbi:MAG: hypothetical protein H2174_04485 [Vampirovibrio sp.]|nr:hypothetical protein [Vampirovibrio sp.]